MNFLLRVWANPDHCAKTDLCAKMALVVDPGWIGRFDCAGYEHPDLFGWCLLPHPDRRIGQDLRRVTATAFCFYVSIHPTTRCKF